MSNSLTADDSQKQAWAVQFNAIQSIEIIHTEPSMSSNWTDSRRSYKITLMVTMKPESAQAPIPYYGWDNGENIRWISLVKENKLWRIDGVGTGPLRCTPYNKTIF